eukprot:scaffold60710_cov31-Tisochrysis_lutea.AAC.2
MANGPKCERVVGGLLSSGTGRRNLPAPRSSLSSPLHPALPAPPLLRVLPAPTCPPRSSAPPCPPRSSLSLSSPLSPFLRFGFGGKLVGRLIADCRFWWPPALGPRKKSAVIGLAEVGQACAQFTLARTQGPPLSVTSRRERSAGRRRRSLDCRLPQEEPPWMRGWSTEGDRAVHAVRGELNRSGVHRA